MGLTVLPLGGEFKGALSDPGTVHAVPGLGSGVGHAVVRIVVREDHVADRAA